MRRVKLGTVTGPISFRETLAAARGGDIGALDSLAAQFYPTVQHIVHHRLATDLRSSRPWLKARFSTGDVVQDVFHSVLRDLGTFAGESEEAFIGYLVMVVRNRIVDAVRFHQAERRDGRRTRRTPTSFDVEDIDLDPSAHVASVEQVERLFEALARFEPREQLLLRARLDNLASFEELAAQLGYGSEATARRAFYAAQARLTLQLKDRREGDR
jgi:RNA polymerase sigma factor (sigma-70 family)